MDSEMRADSLNAAAKVFEAGRPVALREVDVDAAGSRGSIVRIPLLLGLFLAFLLGAILGVPMTIYGLADILAVEASDALVDSLVMISIFGTFALLLTYAMRRHVLRNWLAERKLGKVVVKVNGRKIAGEHMEVTVELPGLSGDGPKSVQLTRKVMHLPRATSKKSVGRPGAKDGDRSGSSRSNKAERWQDSLDLEICTDGVVASASTAFSITDAMAKDGFLLQDLTVEIDIPGGWFDWRSRVTVNEFSPVSLGNRNVAGNEPEIEHAW